MSHRPTAAVPDRAGWWRPCRLGLTGRVLVPALLAIVLAVAAVQAWTVRGAYAEAERRAATMLEHHLTTLREMLRPFGTAWREDGGRLLLGDTALNDRDQVVDAIAKIGGVATVFHGDRRIATSVRRPDGTRGVGTTLAPGAARDAAIGRGEVYRGRNQILGRDYLTIYEPIRDASGRQLGLLFVGTPAADFSAVAWGAARQAIMAGAIVILVIGLAYAALLRRMLRPLFALHAATDRIAAGDLGVDIPGQGRGDEVGALARSLAGLVEGRRHALALEAAAETARQEAAGAAGLARASLAEGLEREVGAVASGLSGSVATLRGVAGTLRATAERMGGEAAAVTSGASQASANVQTVATAAEQLAASVAEITRQVAQSAEVARRAVAETQATDATVAGLAEGAARIGDVVRLISDIAGQTNLLALNATIEAARAGEAGKGFAVVAGEVKQLAAQTAKATEEIRQQIGAIQASTEDAVRSIRGIGGVVGEIDHIASAIAAAVEEQGAATREIARNVAEAAHGTDEVSSGIARVSGAVAETTEALRGLTGTAEGLSGQGEALDGALGRVLEGLRRAA